MTGSWTGGCACGAVRYESGVDPVLMMNCHCRDCQQASGSAFAAIVVVPKDAVQIEGELRFHARTGGSSKRIERGFCPSCGSPVGMRLEAVPDILGLQAGSLDLPSLYRPVMDIFTASAQPWCALSPETQKHAYGLVDRAGD